MDSLLSIYSSLTLKRRDFDRSLHQSLYCHTAMLRSSSVRLPGNRRTEI
jgi:hypothetical protein